ncbi:ribonuclease II [Spirochaetia bacterium]|nr:ribonuclease II [Spirochaetia bacterium]
MRVREKDIEFLHAGPLANLKELDAITETDFREAWELSLSGGSTLTLQDLSELVFNEWTPKTAWSCYCALCDNLYFCGTTNAIKPRGVDEVKETQNKRELKRNEGDVRYAFIERLKKHSLVLPDDERFMQDVEALALGKTEKSRTLHEAGIPEDPIAAHRLLLETGVWTTSINPHPVRWGLSLHSAKKPVAAPPKEPRVDLTAVASFAVDNEGSLDPDDAVGLVPEPENGGWMLYVHVADPAAAVTTGGAADIEARQRGATLYAPEGAARMLCDEALPLFALGLTETSPALTFKIKLTSDCSITNVEIMLSTVKVTRLTYEKADNEAVFEPFFALADSNIKRRRDAGAVFIDFPEVYISVKEGNVSVTPQRNTKSQAAVRECMLLAGEAAALWALQHNIAFPFISQETGDLPKEPLSGLAGAYQLRRCMRPRTLSAHPGLHWGLGLDIYSQVTSPLRRYTDLLAHQQIRAVLTGLAPFSEEEITGRLGVCEHGAIACVRAERASRQFWLCVYLADKIDSVWEGVVLARLGPHAVIFIPGLGMETQTACPKGADPKPNDIVHVKVAGVRLPESTVSFLFV